MGTAEPKSMAGHIAIAHLTHGPLDGTVDLCFDLAIQGRTAYSNGHRPHIRQEARMAIEFSFPEIPPACINAVRIGAAEDADAVGIFLNEFDSNFPIGSRRQQIYSRDFLLGLAAVL